MFQNEHSSGRRNLLEEMWRTSWKLSHGELDELKLVVIRIILTTVSLDFDTSGSWWSLDWLTSTTLEIGFIAWSQSAGKTS